MDDSVGGIQQVRITNYGKDWTTSGPIPRIIDAKDSTARFELRRH
jgi:hypothetical protein